MARLYRSRGASILVICLAVGLVGCSEQNGKKQKVRKVEGVAKHIDLENNQVSMMVKNDKGEEHELQGTVGPETEVWINGRSQSLKDIKAGDRVVVFGYRKGEGSNKKLVATKVEVERPHAGDWKSTSPKTAKVQVQKKPATSTEVTQAPVVRTKSSAQEGTRASATTPTKSADATAAIHAQIRLRLKEAMDKRAALIKNGKTVDDPEVQNLDKIIANAKNILAEGAPAAQPAAAANDSGDLRAQTTDVIYAQIRIRMQEAIEKRATLLKGGKPGSDPEVRKQEGIIMRARDLLTEAGEVVDPVDPPIVQAPPGD